MKCSVNRSVTFTIDLTADESKAFRTVIDVLTTIDNRMQEYGLGGLSSDGGSYDFDTNFMSQMLDTLEGLRSCDRWVEVE